MGWTYKWISSFGTDFAYDYYVSFTPEQVAKGNAYFSYARQTPFDTEVVVESPEDLRANRLLLV